MSVSHTPARCTVYFEAQLYGMRGIYQRRDGNDGMEGEGAAAHSDWTEEEWEPGRSEGESLAKCGGWWW